MFHIVDGNHVSLAIAAARNPVYDIRYLSAGNIQIANSIERRDPIILYSLGLLNRSSKKPCSISSMVTQRAALLNFSKSQKSIIA